MTREQAIKLYRSYVAGVIALGSTKMRSACFGPKSSVTDLGEALQDIGDTADVVIGKLYDAFTVKEPANNGQPVRKTN